MLNFEQYKQISKYYNVDYSTKIFNNLWKKLQVSFKKFECQQEYDESSECPVYDLINKDYSTFSKKLLEFKNKEKPYYTHCKEKGVLLQRMHLIDFPITKYIEFEYYSYYISSILGENIFYNTYDKYRNEELYDFMIFDSKYLIINDYNSNGKLVGAWHLENGEIIKEIEKWYDNVISEASDFKGILKPNKDILEIILK